MMVSELLSTQATQAKPQKDFEFKSIQIHSKKVGRGDLFCAFSGTRQKGHAFIPEALSRGAAGVLTDNSEISPSEQIVYVPELKSILNNMLHHFSDYPEKKLTAFAVTGTNGKTTTAFLIGRLLKEAGNKVMSLGTIENDLNGEKVAASLTTPDPVELVDLMKRGVALGCECLVMEASSHALHQHRLGPMKFHRAVFTNLTQDHLDYHGDMENYYQAKLKLFTRYLKEDGVAIINVNSEFGRRILVESSGRALTYTSDPKVSADVVLTTSDLTLEGSHLQVKYSGREISFSTSLVGAVNLENTLAVIATGFSLGLDPDTINRTLAGVQVPGRNQIFTLPGKNFCVVDYAHTPDALERVLESFRPLVKGKLICVFGCGGDRDRTKRPLMGTASELLSDFSIVTNDNPRTENPQSIAQQILEGFSNKTNVNVILDRRKAIETGLAMLGAGDCLVVAGKGHEDYQIFGTEKTHFDDVEVVKNWIAG